MKTHSPRGCGCLLALLVLLVTTAAIYSFAIYPWISRWGATDIETGIGLPGDELAAAPAYRITRAISVQARPEQIWPALVQLAGERAHLHAAFMPPAYFLAPDRGFAVLSAAEPASLAGCLGPAGGAAAACAATWQFVLQPENDSTTRLILRSQLWAPDLWSTALSRAFQFPAFLSERDLLRSIKARAEQQ